MSFHVQRLYEDQWQIILSIDSSQAEVDAFVAKRAEGLVKAERERVLAEVVDILQQARSGEIDQDWRSVIYRVEGLGRGE